MEAIGMGMGMKGIGMALAMEWDGRYRDGRHRDGGKEGERLGDVRRKISTQGKTKEMNLVSNPKVELRGRVKAKILPAVHRKI